VRFSALVVLHDSEADLRRLLASLERHLDPPPELVVVDSGSSDQGAALAREHGARVIELDVNAGFGAANNAGLAVCSEPVTVLLNPDCVALDAGLTALARLAAAGDAILAPRLLDDDGSVQRSAHPLPGTAAGLLAAVVPPRALPRPLREFLEPYRADAPRRVGWAVAACLAARTDLLRRLGPFDPAAFLFYEDLDLCLRARAAGVPVQLRPEIALGHRGGHSTGPAFGGEAFELQARRRREVIRHQLGARALALDDAAQGLTFALRSVAHRGAERRRNVAALRALRSVRRG
jgi:N-acetylglucosaminyl-diphospho-decaprenol L-rhamnosyltransferase